MGPHSTGSSPARSHGAEGCQRLQTVRRSEPSHRRRRWCPRALPSRVRACARRTSLKRHPRDRPVIRRRAVAISWPAATTSGGAAGCLRTRVIRTKNVACAPRAASDGEDRHRSAGLRPVVVGEHEVGRVRAHGDDRARAGRRASAASDACAAGRVATPLTSCGAPAAGWAVRGVGAAEARRRSSRCRGTPAAARGCGAAAERTSQPNALRAYGRRRSGDAADEAP